MIFSKFQNVEDLNPIVEYSEGTLRIANLSFDFGCSNPCSFRDMTFFLDFFNFFKENLDIKIFTKLEIIISVKRLCQGTLSSCEFRRQV